MLTTRNRPASSAGGVVKYQYQKVAAHGRGLASIALIAVSSTGVVAMVAFIVTAAYPHPATPVNPTRRPFLPSPHFAGAPMTDAERPRAVFTTNPRLSFALHGGGPDLERAMEAVGEEATREWFQDRVGEAITPEDLAAAVGAWFAAATPEDRTLTRADLAELIAEADPAPAELLWDASLREGYERGDSEQAFDATVQLATIAEEADDPLIAAEYYIEFLNWRRQSGHASDPEAVHEAFEAIERLAEREAQHAVAARFTHAHAQFTRVEDAGDETAIEGDWAPGAPPFAGWE